MPKYETISEREERQRQGNLDVFADRDLGFWLDAISAASRECLTPEAILSALAIASFEGLVISYSGYEREPKNLKESEEFSISDPMTWQDVRRIDQRKGYGYSLLRSMKGHTPIEQAFRSHYVDFHKNKGKADQLRRRAFYLVWTLEVFDLSI